MDERHQSRVLGKSKGVDSLEYLPEWVADEQGRPLSLSLPFTPGNQVWRGNVVRDYFDNLLPDSEGIRRRLAMRYKADSLEPFDLLTELGKTAWARYSCFMTEMNPLIYIP